MAKATAPRASATVTITEQTADPRLRRSAHIATSALGLLARPMVVEGKQKNNERVGPLSWQGRILQDVAWHGDMALTVVFSSWRAFLLFAMERAVMLCYCLSAAFAPTKCRWILFRFHTLECVSRIAFRPRFCRDENVIDNEGLGRKSSKRCCIFFTSSVPLGNRRRTLRIMTRIEAVVRAVVRALVLPTATSTLLTRKRRHPREDRKGLRDQKEAKRCPTINDFMPDEKRDTRMHTL